MAIFPSLQSLTWFSAGAGGEGDSRQADPTGKGPSATPAPRIQIVEDEAILAWTLEASLQDLGYEICGIVGTGAGAIRMAAACQPDLIVMDIRLADEVSGLAAAEQILAGRRVPIIFITAYSDREVVQRAAKLGAELLPKPVEPRQVDAVIRRLLAREKEQ